MRKASKFLDDQAPALSEKPYNFSHNGLDSVFNFDLNDRDAPHNRCYIPWNQDFAAIQSF